MKLHKCSNEEWAILNHFTERYFNRKPRYWLIDDSMLAIAMEVYARQMFAGELFIVFHYLERAPIVSMRSITICFRWAKRPRRNQKYSMVMTWCHFEMRLYGQRPSLFWFNDSFDSFCNCTLSLFRLCPICCFNVHAFC